mmetsp:Transcript_96318/g.276546  ORF Transcript_96318/g.276546 Transcript_96318/m.276546 type:complete len:201 (+) Transcript_96318:1502-2104(+)
MAGTGAAALRRTQTCTGLRMPVFIKRCNSLVSVALNKPVRRCFGTADMRASRSEENPSCSNLSASSNTRTSRVLMFSRSLPAKLIIARNRPGVATTIFNLPRSSSLLNASTAALASEPPTKSWLPIRGPATGSSRAMTAKYLPKTSKICPVSSRVGERIAQPMLKEAMPEGSHFSKISTAGIKKANVLPEPVQASTATSL